MEHKALKFNAKLVPLILSGEKTATWRLWDDKGLATGDIVDCIHRDTLEIVATAELTEVVEKPLGQLSAQDKIGHETYVSDQEMYDGFARMYKRDVGPDTLVKIARFKLI